MILFNRNMVNAYYPEVCKGKENKKEYKKEISHTPLLHHLSLSLYI